MSFYIRKSLRVGPFRYNFSKSGVGVSAGFTGFRIGTGPRGNYVHMGRHGLYYRATLPTSNSRPVNLSPPPQPSTFIDSSVEMMEIESVDVLQLHDSSATELLSEMNNKHKKLQLWPIAAILAVAMLIILIALRVPVWVYGIAIPIAAIVIFFLYWRDQLGKSVILFYELDSDSENAFQLLHNAFSELTACAQAWHISASGKITNLQEWKRQAGADSLIRRTMIRFALQNPPYVKTNLSIPAIPVGKQTLYFFPDRVLVYENGKVGAVPYSDIQLDLDNTRFIESQSLPRDAQIVGQTWQYVNKKGGPDKRFKNNKQLPITLYGELYFKSSGGLNELIQVSKSGIGASLADSFKELASAQQRSSTLGI